MDRAGYLNPVLIVLLIMLAAACGDPRAAPLTVRSPTRPAPSLSPSGAPTDCEVLVRLTSVLRPLAFATGISRIPTPRLKALLAKVQANLRAVSEADKSLLERIVFWLDQTLEEGSLTNIRTAHLSAHEALYESCRGEAPPPLEYPPPELSPLPQAPPSGNPDEGAAGISDEGGDGNPAGRGRYPRIDDWSGVHRINYKTMFDLCEAFGVKQVADEMGVRNDPTEVALAYAETGYTKGYEQAAFEGCYDGFVFIGEALPFAGT
jgi:hypothetical protein